MKNSILAFTFLFSPLAFATDKTEVREVGEVSCWFRLQKETAVDKYNTVFGEKLEFKLTQTFCALDDFECNDTINEPEGKLSKRYNLPEAGAESVVTVHVTMDHVMLTVDLLSPKPVQAHSVTMILGQQALPMVFLKTGDTRHWLDCFVDIKTDQQ